MIWLQEALLVGIATAMSLVSVGMLHVIQPQLALRQGIWIILGLGVYILIRRFSPSLLRTALWIGYVLHLLLLMATYAIGHGPVHRWITLGPVTYQPSEGIKAILIGLLPMFLLRPYIGGVLQGAVLAGIPMILILFQPDLATAGMIGFLALIQGFLAGISARILLPLITFPFLIVTVVAPGVFWGILVVGSLLVLLTSLGRAYLLFYVVILTLGGVLTPLVWKKLRPYQQERIVRFIQPSDPHAAWQSYQAEIAIGSGGLWGRGYGKGTQHSLQFLPAAHTDFIFASFAEEWGFVGASLVLLAFFILIWNLISWGSALPDARSQLTVHGIAAYFFLHAFFNIGMNLRIFPVAGLPLPFMSYGGSHLLTEYALLGMAAAHFRTTWAR